MAIYIFDIDGTICSQQHKGDYENATPYENRINRINNLYDNGDKIIYCTARGMGRFSNDVVQVYSTFYELTKEQLIKWNAKHHQLFLGKPSGDYYVDDKGVNADVFFGENR